MVKKWGVGLSESKRLTIFTPGRSFGLHFLYYDLSSMVINDENTFRRIRTPFYYYDMPLLEQTADTVAELCRRYDIHVHYAVKANYGRRVMEVLSSRGFGADCVSGNEVVRAFECGFQPSRIMFTGVGKTDAEMAAGLRLGIQAFNVESMEELAVLDGLAGRMGVVAHVGLRINPGIDAHTHKFITTGLTENKFGIALRDLDAVIDALRECRNVYFEGLQFHIGSQITDIEGVYAHECRRADEVADYFEQKGMPVHNLDLGGGLGVDYDDPDSHPIPEFERWFKVVDASLKRRKDRRIHLEPGRALVAQCGTLVSQVLYVKHAADKDFLVLDAGMNDLIRPALYGARHRIMKFFAAPDTPMHRYDVVGPVCESSDVFAEGALLPQCQRGDLVGLRSAGAYGQVMSSRYNLRDMAPSVFSDRLAVAPMRESFPEK